MDLSAFSGYGGYMVIVIIMSVVGMVISGRLRGKFNKYSRVGLRSGMSGRDVAEAMLRHFGIHDVRIVEGQGMLTDHYNPLTRTVSLSPEVYHGQSIASAAVAAHECGHAVQHAQAYAWLQLRSAVVPAVNFASMVQQYLLLAVFMVGASAGSTLLLITIVVFAITTTFSLITLPVEFDASRRALAWLDQSGVARGGEHEGAKDALWWAAMTYVAAALSALVMLLFLILRYTSSNND